MALAEQLAVTQRGKSGPVCKVCSFLIDLPKKDAKTLAEALEGNTYTSRQIAEALTLEGYTVTRGSVARHRRGDCIAPK